MNTIKLIVVVSIVLLSTDVVYHQIVNAQETGKSMVDKLIQNTKGNMTLEQSYMLLYIKRNYINEPYSSGPEGCVPISVLKGDSDIGTNC